MHATIDSRRWSGRTGSPDDVLAAIATGGNRPDLVLPHNSRTHALSREQAHRLIDSCAHAYLFTDAARTMSAGPAAVARVDTSPQRGTLAPEERRSAVD